MRTLWEIFRTSANRLPVNTALIDNTLSVTYQDLSRIIESFAANLQELRVKRGDRVCIVLPKGWQEVVAILATSRIGAIFVPVNPQLKLPQIAYIVRNSGSRVLITDQFRSQRYEKALARDLDYLIVSGLTNTARDNIIPFPETPGSLRPTDHVVSCSDTAAILYTSGSTGQPKGVILSHGNLTLSAESVCQYLEIQSSDRLLGLLPLCFDYGLNQLISSIYRGATYCIQTIMMPSEVVKTVKQQNITGLASVPTGWIQIVKYLLSYPTELPSLRYITNSGGSLPTFVLDAFPSVFPDTDIVQMYGLTEGFRSSYVPPNMYERKKGAIGIAIPNVELYVVNEEMELSDSGELVHRGPLISQGYWNNERDTNEKIKPCKGLEHLIGHEKVLFSGDLVKRDDDGFLWFIGRKDNMIKSNGIRISPSEIEDVLYSIANIFCAVAFGRPDEVFGQAVEAVISGRVDNEIVSRAFEKCGSCLAPYMNPRKIYVREADMPLTANNKIDRVKVLAELERCKVYENSNRR